MSLNLNHVVVAGHLTRDPQLKMLANEKSVVQFGIAINRRYKGADGEFKEDTTFVDVEAWGRTAELVGQYLQKGSPCYVEGRLKLDSWEDKEGQKRSRLKVVADNVQFLSTGQRRGEGAGAGDGGERAGGDTGPGREPAMADAGAQAGAPSRPARPTVVRKVASGGAGFTGGDPLDQPPF